MCAHWLAVFQPPRCWAPRAVQLNFTPCEAAALVAALAVAGPMPMTQAARSGLAKIATAMSPADRLRHAELVRRRILVPERGDQDTSVATTVARALADRRILEIGYRDRREAFTHRAVEPINLMAVDDRWYLVAGCRLRGDHRAFRLDRIGAAEMGRQPVPRRQPPEWDCDLPIRLRKLTIGG